ncbi:NAD-binding protein [Halapricum desulfuricans]|uniref:Kef-type K+ transport system, predicted NAD-binding component n=1 Tax=Halapricum desulfuricans TaxID=2841257 RepID=A0A897N190_9EURY|nr:NAD-binding protein [Halapricum desulfuricans]QSG06271.1 Kef-type K+ transport system, predicted NAD-binding component [Halapricum desulfuricans]
MIRHPGARATVWLVTVVAVLSFAVGVVNIASQEVALLSAYVPESIQRLAGFTGAMTGFLMLTSAYGLRKRLRAAWYSTLVLLPVAALQGLVQPGTIPVPLIEIPIPASTPLVVLSVVSIPLVASGRSQYTESWSLSTSQLAALSALVGAQIYGTVGTYALREHFPGVNTAFDAFYFTLVTASTVGYGDLTAATQIGRLFSTSVLVIGVASFGVAAGTLLGPAIEARFAAALGQMSEAQLSMLEDHIIVMGYGELTEPILEGLDEARTSFIVVTPDRERASSLRDRELNVLIGDPSDEQPLYDAGIERATGVVAATNNDAEDALAILTARELNPEIRIVAAATDRQNIDKLRRAGADAVISPAVIGGHLLVQSALGEAEVESVADRILGTSGEEVEEIAQDEPEDA